MKTTELKLRIQTTAEDLINIYFNENNIIDKLTNSTLKVLLKNNIYRIDDILNLFADKNGDVDAKSIIDVYAETIGDGIPFDIKGYVQNEFIRNLLPNKTLIITKDDINKIIQGDNNSNTTFISHGNEE